MSEQEIIELKNKKVKSNTEREIILQSNLFNDRLGELRNKDVDMGWGQLSKQLSDEFNMNINSSQLQKKYINEASIEIQVDTYAEKQFTGFIGGMAERYKQLNKITDKLMSTMNKIIDKIDEIDDSDQIEKLLTILKIIKTIQPLNKAVLDQLQFVRDEQNKITAKLFKNRKEITDDDIREKSYKVLPELLEVLRAQGKIEVIDQSILKYN